MTSKLDRFLSLVAIGTTVSVTGIWWYLINRYSVNMLFWDQWDLFDAFIKKANFWELYNWQHGPHRQGIGFLLMKLTNHLSGWNTRVDCVVIGIITSLSAITAILLSKRITQQKALTWMDGLIPLIVMTPLQYGIVVNTPNFSHGAIPLLLILLLACAFQIPFSKRRYAAILVLNALAVYSGMAVFVGLIVPVLLVVDAWRLHQQQQKKLCGVTLGAVMLSLATLAAFFTNYRFNPAIDGFEFPISEGRLYAHYVALALSGFIGMRHDPGLLALMVGYCLLITFLAILWVAAKTLLIPSRNLTFPDYARSQVLVLFIGFTLVFCGNAAIGRIFLGRTAGQASRYIPYLIPAFLALYLFYASLPMRIRWGGSLVYMMIMIAATHMLSSADLADMQFYYRIKTHWKTNYLRTRSIEQANQAAGHPMHPNEDATGLQEKLDFLEARHLNLFK
jgi:hypothetical protein